MYSCLHLYGLSIIFLCNVNLSMVIINYVAKGLIFSVKAIIKNEIPRTLRNPKSFIWLSPIQQDFPLDSVGGLQSWVVHFLIFVSDSSVTTVGMSAFLLQSKGTWQLTTNSSLILLLGSMSLLIDLNLTSVALQLIITV